MDPSTGDRCFHRYRRGVRTTVGRARHPRRARRALRGGAPETGSHAERGTRGQRRGGPRRPHRSERPGTRRGPAALRGRPDRSADQQRGLRHGRSLRAARRRSRSRRDQVERVGPHQAHPCCARGHEQAGAWRHPQRLVQRRLAAGAAHGDLRRHQSVRVLVHPGCSRGSARDRRPRHAARTRVHPHAVPTGRRRRLEHLEVAGRGVDGARSGRHRSPRRGPQEPREGGAGLSAASPPVAGRKVAGRVFEGQAGR